MHTDSQIRDEFRNLQHNTGWTDQAAIDAVAENHLSEDATYEQREAMRARVRSVVVEHIILAGGM